MFKFRSSWQQWTTLTQFNIIYHITLFALKTNDKQTSSAITQEKNNHKHC